ncbi:hypothetical protein PC129_g12155 [Phytophthora cactorum]|uniref:Uncharacterized protein n=1 Tax=Phytophthora cactorum TaxID=29920 RepID=A0A8T1HZ17_9STRA|nr:hypothetical protein PC114_g15142 [Phytophthora cactorum]KAG2909452.1 hypothetical protein PC115_g13238 [Phytophthora cactorum]KAG3217008.1 hypothetical protein PC129_g12155 [Phytophthora cactorum]
MTPRYAWKTVCSDMAREDSQLLMEDMKVFIIVKSHLVPCSVCDLTRPHKMRYQLLRCSSETCKAATPYDACQWLGNKLACQELNRVTIAESGIHKTLVREPRQSQLTPRLKDYGREMATQGLKPARIRVGMARRFGLSEAEMPTLRQVQWFISHYSKKTLHRNDDHDEILVQIDQLAYGPQVSDTSPFSFGWERDVRGKPDVDNGSDENPFLQLLVKYVMANAEAAQQNAVSQVFGVDSDYAYLMYFYHVMAKVHEKLKGIPDSLCERVVADIYDLHFASSKEVYDEQMKIVLEKWSREGQLVSFRSYFNNIWMKNEAAARYLRNWGLIQRDTGDAIKRLLDAVPQTRITKARLIEAAAKGDDAGEQEWVLPSGVDLEVFLLTRCAPFWMTSGSTGELFS